jgi:hypothetical protein
VPRQQAAASQGASKLAHTKGASLECGSLLPPWFCEACFARMCLHDRTENRSLQAGHHTYSRQPLAAGSLPHSAAIPEADAGTPQSKTDCGYLEMAWRYVITPLVKSASA